MTEFKQIMIEKNFTVKYVSKLLGICTRNVDHYISGSKIAPAECLYKLQEADQVPHDGLRREDFIALLTELGLTWLDAATILAIHKKRMAVMVDITLPGRQFIAIYPEHVNRLYQRALKNNPKKDTNSH